MIEHQIVNNKMNTTIQQLRINKFQLQKKKSFLLQMRIWRRSTGCHSVGRRSIWGYAFTDSIVLSSISWLISLVSRIAVLSCCNYWTYKKQIWVLIVILHKYFNAIFIATSFSHSYFHYYLHMKPLDYRGHLYVLRSTS